MAKRIPVRHEIGRDVSMRDLLGLIERAMMEKG